MYDQKVTINVDINVNQDNLKQIPQLKTALDNLRESVTNLNKQVITFNEQNKETVTWGTKIKSTVKELTNTFNTFKSITDIASKALGGWSGILAGAFTLITTYGPDVLDFFSDLFQSEKTRAAAKALKEYKEIMNGYIENVAGKMSKAQQLINIANNDNLPGSQIEAIKKLNSLAPEFLQNLTLKNLKTKEGKAMIDEYIKSLQRQAMEESTQEKRQEKVKQRLALQDSLEKAKKVKDDYFNHVIKDKITYSTDGVPGNFGGQLKRHSSREDAKSNLIALVKQDQELLADIKRIDDNLGISLLKFAPKLKAQSAPLNTDQHNKAKHHPLPDKARPAAEALEAKSISFAQTIELDKQNYQTEQALLDDQLKKKLISQEQYQQQKQQLEEKFHLAIGTQIKEFSQKELDDVQRHLKDLYTIQNNDDVMAGDEKAVKKAILPADKLNAEKQLINDKYTYEIALAAGNTEKIKQLELQKQQDITAIDKRYQEQRKAFAMETAQKVSDTAFSMLKGGIQQQADARIKSLENQKQAELKINFKIAA